MHHEGQGPFASLLLLARTVLEADSAALYQIDAAGAWELRAQSGGEDLALPSDAWLDALKTGGDVARLPAGVMASLVRKEDELVGVLVVRCGEAFEATHRENLEQVVDLAATLLAQTAPSAQAIGLYQMDQHPVGSDEHYRAFVAQSSEGIWCYKFDTPIPTYLPVEEQIQQAFEMGQMVISNDAMARMYGFEQAKDLEEDSLFRRIPLGEFANQQNLKAFFENGYRVSNVETLEYDRYGEVRFFSNNVVGIVENGHLVRVWGSQVDITSRKQAEQSFLDSEERWHRLVERHPQPILITHDGFINQMNQAGLDLLGAATQEEVQGRRLHDFIAPEMHDLLDQRIRTVAHDQLEAPRQYKVLPLRGEPRYIEAFSLPVVYEGQNVVQTVWRDVTERYRAEAALRDSEHLLSSVNESITEGIYRSTLDGDILYINEALVRMFGFDSVAEMKALAKPSLFYSDAARRDEILVLLLKTRGFENEEVAFLRKDGTSFWGLMSASVMLDDNGDMWAYNGVITDITERKEAAQALAESEERWRSLVESHPEPILISEGDRILYLNEATVQMLRANSAEELYERLVSDFLAPEYYQVREERLQALARGETVKPMEFRIFDVEGNERYVEAIGVPTTYEGRVATQVVMRDTTERHRYEQALIEAREKALEMARLKSAFLANMSHEIRTPLTAIIGFADVLAEEVKDENREFAQLIRQSGQRLMETLNSVLDLAQIESGSMELAAKRVDVVNVAWQVLNLFTVQARQQKLDLKLDAPDAPVHAWLDAGALSRSLTNLVANALKFTATGYVCLRVRTDDKGLELCVEDTGVGIGEAFIAKIFGEFYQESSGIARGYEGSGLGLAITHRLVEMMGGTIQVESKKGKGSLFTLRFPVQVLHAPEPLTDHTQTG